MVLRDSGRTLHGALERAARTDPHRPVVEFPGVATYTAGELYSASCRTAAALRAGGVGPGDRVVLLLGNRPEFLTTFLAATMLGAVAVPLNTALRGRALAETVAQFARFHLVTEPAFAGHLPAAVDELLASIWTVEPASSLPTARALSPSAEDSIGTDLGGLPAMQPWDLATILLTSGTTGASKGVMWSHNTALTFAEGATWVMGYTDRDVVYTCLPLFHINALLTAFVPGLLTGARIVVAPRFSVTTFWAEVAACGATVTNMMGAMSALLWRCPPGPEETDHRLRLAMVLPLPADRLEFERRFGVPTTEVYGSTDTGLPIGIPFGERRPGSCGVAAPGWEVALVDEDDEPVARGVPGELVTRPAVPFAGTLGYWRNPEYTASCLRNQWFHTGDLLRQDEDGWYYYLDRRKDALRVSGENVSTVEVERALLRHPDVAEAAAYGVPSELGEDSVAAAVVARPGALLDPAALRAFVAPDLPYFAVPRYIDVRTELPRTATEKVRKAALRSAGVTPGMWDGGPPRRAG